MSLPPFNSDGVLPVGDYPLTLAELRCSELVLGYEDPKNNPNWDAVWRENLVDNLGVLVSQLRQVGISEVFVDGSFVEDKDHPNDIDGYFPCDIHRLASGELQRELNLLDPHKVWTWSPSSRRKCRGFPKAQLPMWHIYRVELYPHFLGNKTGIRDDLGNDLEFPAAFRRSRRDGKPKGIIKLQL
jgi:hypothetical protein